MGTHRQPVPPASHFALSFPIPQLALAAALPTPAQEEMENLRDQQRQLHEQLFEAAQIQRKLSGPRSLRRGKFQFGSEVFAARYIPGDFTALWEIGDTVVFAIGDIAGKGVAAGMWFTYMAGLLRTSCVNGADPAATLADLNWNLCSLRPSAPFSTIFLAHFNCATGDVIYCNAGHFAPVILRSNGRRELLDRGGPLLGALPDSTYEFAHFRLRSGDSMFAYSDGVLECRNASDQEFGIERLIAAAEQTKHFSAQTAVLSVLASLQDFANGAPPADDITLMMVQAD
jgi:sigma-B regulation protein RsbU (phosphoserine phosphatase)